MTDIINEFYGPRAVRRISYTAVALISYAFLMFFLATRTVPPQPGWSVTRKMEYPICSLPSMVCSDKACGIIGSLVAFLVSQIVDVTIFHKIKKLTGEKHVWLRATGSTIVSQLVDSYIVLFIAFSGTYSWQFILAVGMVNYAYKFIMAIVLTPLIYLMERRIEKYFGPALTHKMKQSAMGQGGSRRTGRPVNYKPPGAASSRSHP